jgi:hypothetical protein
MNTQPYSSKVLALCGLILIGMGLYFALRRPALLPEDARATRVRRSRSLGPPFRAFWIGSRRVSGTVTLAGLTSIGWMAAVNFIIDTDYKWLLLAFAALWGAALELFWLEGRGERRTTYV